MGEGEWGSYTILFSPSSHSKLFPLTSLRFTELETRWSAFGFTVRCLFLWSSPHWTPSTTATQNTSRTDQFTCLCSWQQSIPADNRGSPSVSLMLFHRRRYWHVKILSQCWVTVGPASETLDPTVTQHCDSLLFQIIMPWGQSHPLDTDNPNLLRKSKL